MQELLHTDAFTHREGFTHRSVYTRKLLRREPKRLHSRFQTCNFTPLFDGSTVISCKTVATEVPSCKFTQVFDVHFVRRVASQVPKMQFYTSFWNSTLVSCERATLSPSKFACHHMFALPTRTFAHLTRTISTSSSHFTTRCTLVRRTPTISAGDQIRIFTSFHHMFVRSASTIFAENDFKFAFHRTFVRSTFAISAKCHVSMDTAGLPLPP